jgi:protein required for attachment to host cells
MGKVTVPRGFDPKFVKHWYLVANRAEALVYEGGLNGAFRYVKRLKNPKGKLTELQLVSDRPGRTFSSARTGTRHGYEPRTPYHEAVAQQFARKIAEMLEAGALDRQYSDLVVMAEPHFLGLLKKALPKHVRTLVRREVAREWAQGSDTDLEEYLREKLTG